MPSHPTPGLAPRTIVPMLSLPARPGLVGIRISATDVTGLDWPRIDDTWRAAGEANAISSAWSS